MDNDTITKNSSLQQEVLFGLRQNPKRLSSKFFYDERGSELFERITDLPEYYPTRTEMQILQDNLEEIAQRIGSRAMLIELGSGSSKKIRQLLQAISDLAAYIPVDISAAYLKKTVVQLHKDFPDLRIEPVCADYTRQFSLPEIDADYKKQVLFYPGSTIGNFHPDVARDFLQEIARLTAPKAAMLVGVDMKKDPEILEQAYNDSQGVTATFNKNILVHLNRELNADFEVNDFSHHAFYNKEEGRIEMHLISTEEQQVHISGETFYFREGESIHTENSYKYSLREFRSLVSDWFEVEKVWTDERERFSLQYLVKR